MGGDFLGATKRHDGVVAPAPDSRQRPAVVDPVPCAFGEFYCLLERGLHIPRAGVHCRQQRPAQRERARYLRGTAAGAAAREAFAVTGHALGRGLAALCNLLNLDKVILSGQGAIAYALFRSGTGVVVAKAFLLQRRRRL